MLSMAFLQLISSAKNIFSSFQLESKNITKETKLKIYQNYTEITKLIFWLKMCNRCQHSLFFSPIIS